MLDSEIVAHVGPVKNIQVKKSCLLRSIAPDPEEKPGAKKTDLPFDIGDQGENVAANPMECG